jgi:hypothetical protein
MSRVQVSMHLCHNVAREQLGCRKVLLPLQLQVDFLNCSGFDETYSSA